MFLWLTVPPECATYSLRACDQVCKEMNLCTDAATPSFAASRKLRASRDGADSFDCGMCKSIATAAQVEKFLHCLLAV